jgi:predicted porin
LGLGVRYANGPLYLAAAYHALSEDSSAERMPTGAMTNRGYGAKGWGVGGSYDFKVVKVFANYFRAKANHSGLAHTSRGADGGSDKQTMWSLGVGIPVSSAGTVMAEYAQYKDYLNRGLRIGTPTGGTPDLRYLDGRTAGHKAKGYSLGYKHTLSKRTILHAYATRIDNDRGINAGWVKTGVAGQDQTIFSAGIVDLF